MATTTKAPAAQHRPAEQSRAIAETVMQIIADVTERGDAAVQEWSARLDRWERQSFRLDEVEIDRIVASVPGPVLEDIRFSQAQVRRFAEAQRSALTDVEVETVRGVTLGHRNIPIGSAGSYVPGGRYPIVASAQMGIVTAKVAGVERVAACTPPLAGEFPAATIAAMHLAGADDLLRRRRPGDRRSGTRDGDDRRGGFHRRAWERVRSRGEGAAVRPGRDRAARGPDRDPRDRRRDCRS